MVNDFIRNFIQFEEDDFQVNGFGASYEKEENWLFYPAVNKIPLKKRKSLLKIAPLSQ